MTHEAASYREDVEQLRRRFEEFGSTPAVRSRLPEERWAAAAKLARRDGMEATAQALDVDRPSLRKWTNRFEARAETKTRKPRRQRQPRREPAAAAFVELRAGNSGATASCLVEVESTRGAKLRLELKAMATSARAELMRAFAGS
jgi:hypothetical protein